MLQGTATNTSDLRRTQPENALAVIFLVDRTCTPPKSDNQTVLRVWTLNNYLARLLTGSQRQLPQLSIQLYLPENVGLVQGGLAPTSIVCFGRARPALLSLNCVVRGSGTLASQLILPINPIQRLEAINVEYCRLMAASAAPMAQRRRLSVVGDLKMSADVGLHRLAVDYIYAQACGNLIHATAVSDNSNNMVGGCSGHSFLHAFRLFLENEMTLIGVLHPDTTGEGIIVLYPDLELTIAASDALLYIGRVQWEHRDHAGSQQAQVATALPHILPPLPHAHAAAGLAAARNRVAPAAAPLAPGNRS